MDCGRQIRGDHGQLFTCEGTIEVRVPVYFDVLYKQHKPHKLALNGIGTHEDSVEIVANCSDCGAAPARVIYPPIFRAVEAMAAKPETHLRRPRVDVITCIDSDGNPDTATFIDGIRTDSLLRHNIHHHTIDGGRSGQDHAWACSMYEHSTDPRFPEQVRAAFAEALQRSSHHCKDHCESCENCGDEPCPLISDSNAPDLETRTPPQ
ncbi:MULTISPECIES: hypothetical protein [unclassified Streptomyces]|uniref:hypothetical protein n=1 Tax=unclassified Streptomyces TaxID=2593676 RepID=UPI0022590268|nr:MULTISPECIES: hypothetical protein [unclassified Streptomyces]MCX4405956.1 hypothetical protein [Streptomyces sp. NBC_01764]MCX5189520.1 hypothetical protein [Streptomyces sp. NBC_00268]